MNVVSLRSLHSLTGVVPVGAFMLLQLWLHAKALDGADAHREAMLAVAGPAAKVWQWLIILPLAFHAGYGVVLSLRPRYTVKRYPLSRNWMYALQRATGFIALILIADWTVNVWWPMQSGALAAGDLYTLLTGRLSATSYGVPWIAVGYMIGLGACAFHLANGLWSFGARWGLTKSRDSRSRAGVALALFGLAVFVFAAHTVVFLATGWRAFGEPTVPTDQAAACEVGGE